MEKTITVFQFVKNLEKIPGDNLKKDYKKKNLKVKSYIPYKEKLSAIQILIDTIFENGKYDSVEKFRKFSLKIVELYTCLIIEDPIRDFDLLSQNLLLDEITSFVGPDVDVFLDFFNKKCEDYLRNFYGI